MFSKMDKKIQIVEIQSQETSTGGRREAGTKELVNDWASIKPMTGRKLMEYRRLNYDNPYDVVISNRPNVEPETWPKRCRAKYNGRNYEIISVFITDDKRFIRMEIQR